MTQEELQSYYDWNKMCFDEYKLWRMKSYHYERNSKFWKPNWKHARNIMKKYGCKYSMQGDFSQIETSYQPYFNEITIMPPGAFVQIHQDGSLGYCNYFTSLYYQIFYLILEKEFEDLVYDTCPNALEMIINEAVKDIAVADICRNDACYIDDNKEDMCWCYHAILFPLEDKIKEYFDNFTEQDNIDYVNLKDTMTNKIKEVYNECMPKSKQKFDISFYERSFGNQ